MDNIQHLNFKAGDSLAVKIHLNILYCECLQLAALGRLNYKCFSNRVAVEIKTYF